jgi:signal transduction histidine kinase
MSSPAAPGRDRTPRPADVALAGVVALLTLIGFGASVVDDFPFLLVDHDGQPQLPVSRALIEVLAEALPLMFRRAAPVPVFLLVAGASLADEALNRHAEPLPLAVLVALYTLAVTCRPVVVGMAAAGYLAGLAADAATAWTDVSDDQLYIDLVAVAGTVTLGYWIYVGRARVSRAERRTLEVIRGFDARTQEAVDEERARIAREMHDALGHQLSVIVAQAAISRRVADDRPQVATEALGDIESVGRDALSGLRRLLGVLRADRGRPDGTRRPGLDRLGTLVQQVGRAGLPVELVVRGIRRRLPDDVELNAFRIVQEALTNCLKYSGRTLVTITITYGDDALDIDVADAGGTGSVERVKAGDAEDAPPVGGFGLVGMRQRVERVGGAMTAGSDGGDGFRVSARLPVAKRRTTGTAIAG